MPDLKPPQQAALITDDWVAAFRDAAHRAPRGPGMHDSYRAGLHAPTIEAWSVTRGWMPVMLCSGSNRFVSVEDRDAVLARIRG